MVSITDRGRKVAAAHPVRIDLQVRHTAGRFGQVIDSSQVTDVLAAEERKFRELVSRDRTLLVGCTHRDG